MKKLILFLLLLPILANAQGARYDSAVTTSANNVPPGAQAPVYTLPYAVVTVCNYPASGSPCTNTASVYTNPALSGSPIPQPMTADVHGRFGFWGAPGMYAYSLASSTGTNYGTFNISLAGSGGGSATFPSTPNVVCNTSISAARNCASADVVSLFSSCTGTKVLQADGTCGNATTFLSAGTNITITGAGTSGSPYVISATSGGPLTIASFSGCSNQELGFSISNPAYSASYSGTPTSANITNTESIDSPHALTTPFTAVTLSGTFVHTTTTTTTFTLHASDGTSSPTATCNSTWNPRIFSGTGASGTATSATASGTTAVLVGDTGTLPSAQLGAETVGTTFVFNLTGNYFYMLLVGGSHTFNVNGFPATLASTPVSFVNANGVTVSMNLYVGPTFGTGTYTVVVTG